MNNITTFVTCDMLIDCCWVRGDGCWKCLDELSSNDVRLEPAEVEVAMVMGVAIGEDGRLVAVCCDGNGGLGDSLLLVELKVKLISYNMYA